MNSVVLTGRLTKDAEVRYTSENMAIATITIAVDRPKRDGESKADFPKVIVFGKQAENLQKYTGKGCKIGIEGRLQTGSYTNKEGQKVYTTEVVANRVEFLQWKDDKEDKQQMQFTEVDDEEIPF